MVLIKPFQVKKKTIIRKNRNRIYDSSVYYILSTKSDDIKTFQCCIILKIKQSSPKSENEKAISEEILTVYSKSIFKDNRHDDVR